MKQRGQVLQMRFGQGASQPSPLNDSERYRPGILIFSRRSKLLHMNCRALELTGRHDRTESEPACGILSGPVYELRDAIQAGLDQRRDADTWEFFELKRVCSDASRKILVRGFGLSDRNAPDNSRIVIVLEELALREERTAPQR
jgi:hypothetical protein